MKAKIGYLFTAIGLTVTLAAPAGAATLLTDNFTDTTSGSTSNLNENLGTRQTGTQTANGSWTGGGNAQIGNNTVFGGDGNYLMVADGGTARLAGLTLSTSLVAANEKLVIQFDADAVGPEWMSFVISSSGATFPTVGSGDFGMLIRTNGQIQAFNNFTGSALSGINNVQSDSSGINTITLTFSDLAGTGSAFAGNGTKVTIFDGTNTWSANLDTGFTTETISFGTYGAGDRGLVDNLSITTIPEPGAALLGGLGMLALLRRRRA